MPKSFEIVVEGDAEPGVVEDILAGAGLDVRRGRQTRGLAGVLSWIVSATSIPSQAAGRLVDGAADKLVGSTVKVQVGDRMVEVTNLNRSEVKGILEEAAKIAGADT